LARSLSNLVQHHSARFGGNAVKWLGDGGHVPLPRTREGRACGSEHHGCGGRGRSASGPRRSSRRPRVVPGG
jgi:hypothetical protein